MREEPRLRVAVFRPADERIENAVELLESLGADPVPDPMLEVHPTGATPADAEYVVLTSKTGVELAAEAGWQPGAATLVAIGSSTADAMCEAGYDVDIVPEEYTSAGLVEAMAGQVDDATVEVARSDHGSPVLLDGLDAAGADVHETVLYELVRPGAAGESVELAADGKLDAVLFTSSLTVEHFLDIAEERGIRDAVLEGLDDAIVGVIGDPTSKTAEAAGLSVDVVPETIGFESLAAQVVERAAPTHSE